jgi:hypothetical protein
MKMRTQLLALIWLGLISAAAWAAPSAEFRAFVETVRIDGVFSGNPQKIYVNKKVYRVGAVLHQALGVKLVAVDLAGKTVTFEDRTGERLTKEYGRPN